MTDLEQEVRDLRASRDTFKRALEHHLCPYDIADWIGCAGGHGEDCSICASRDKSQHRHALLTRAEAAEAALEAQIVALQSLAESIRLEIARVRRYRAGPMNVTLAEQWVVEVKALSVRLTRHQTEENDEKDHTRVDGHS